MATIRVRASVLGIGNLTRAVGKETKAVNRTIRDSLDRCAEVVLRKARHYCPVQTSALWRSGHTRSWGEAWGARALVSFGNEEAWYAFIVHEDLTKTHTPPWCAKFLERAERETRGTCTSIIRRDLVSQRTISYVPSQDISTNRDWHRHVEEGGWSG